MNKVLGFTLTSLALMTLASPAFAQFGGSVRGDVGILGNQLPFFIVATGLPPTVDSNTITYFSRRKEGQWDFTGRVFAYTSCAPCATYIAASWQGSNQTVHSCRATESIVDSTTDTFVFPIIPLRIVNPHDSGVVNSTVALDAGSPVSSKIEVKNKFSKAKLGFGFDLIKRPCFAFTMEVGGNYLDAHLNADIRYTITQTVAQGAGDIIVPPGNTVFSPGAGGLPFDYVIHDDTHQKTEGVGLYATFKAEYKFPPTCLGNCFSLYGKAEVADIIGRQKYAGRICYENGFEIIDGVRTPIPLEMFNYEEHICNRYNNVVEFDLEAALVYSPCFKCWNNLNLNFALGVRIDSFVNLFSMPVEYIDVTYLSLTRPTVFFEVGIKI